MDDARSSKIGDVTRRLVSILVDETGNPDVAISIGSELSIEALLTALAVVIEPLPETAGEEGVIEVCADSAERLADRVHGVRIAVDRMRAAGGGGGRYE